MYEKKLENLQNLQNLQKFWTVVNHVQQTLLCLGFLRLKEVDFLLFWFEWLHEWLETISIDFEGVLAI